MKIRTSELQGAALDWAVCKAEDDGLAAARIQYPDLMKYFNKVSPSTYWDQGGPIIEREKLSVGTRYTNYHIYHDADVLCWARDPIGGFLKYGPTPLIAAMRCFVASRLGDEVEIPVELV